MSKKCLLTKALVWLTLFVLLLGSAIYLAVRPVSYYMEYYGETNDEYGFFAAERYYTRDNYVIINNTNYDIPIVSFYYYKDGYTFDLRAQTEAEYAQEVQKINSEWEAALRQDFYAEQISAYKMLFIRPDGAEMVYTCKAAIVLTAVCGVAALAAAGASGVYFARYRKEKEALSAEA